MPVAAMLSGAVHQPVDLALGEVAPLDCQAYDAWGAFLGCRFHADRPCLRLQTVSLYTFIEQSDRTMSANWNEGSIATPDDLVDQLVRDPSGSGRSESLTVRCCWAWPLRRRRAGLESAPAPIRRRRCRRSARPEPCADHGDWRRTVRPGNPAAPSARRKPVSRPRGEDSTPIGWRMGGGGRGSCAGLREHQCANHRMPPCRLIAPPRNQRRGSARNMVAKHTPHP